MPAQKFFKKQKMQSNFWSGSKNLDLYKTFWDLWKDEALVYIFVILRISFSSVFNEIGNIISATIKPKGDDSF